MDRSALGSLSKAALIRLVVSQAEVIGRFESVLARVGVLEAENAALRARIVELEARLGLPPKTPDNSSTPPSLGRKGSADSAGVNKGKPHAGAYRALHDNPAFRLERLADVCQHCGTDVSGVVQSVHETYDHIEFPRIVPAVTRVSLHGGMCPCCGKPFKAPAPAGMAPGSPFGPRLRALAVYLRFTQGIALARLKTLLVELAGLDISEGALVNMLKASRPGFAAQTKLIREALMAGTVIESDETGLRVGRKNFWLWVFHHGTNAVFIADPSRGKTVVETFLDGHRPHHWVSDRYGGQLGWAEKDNQVCLAHLIRDVQYAIDAGDTILAPGVRHLLGHACQLGQRRAHLADSTLRTYAADLERKLDKLLAKTPTHPEGIKLHRMLKKVRRHLFVFMTNRAVPPTNNGSERALRPCVTFRKITNGFRTQWGAELYADIRTVIETGRRRTIGALDAITLTLDRKPLLHTTP